LAFSIKLAKRRRSRRYTYSFKR